MQSNEIEKNQESRVDNSIRNVASSIVLAAFSVVMPFVIRTVMAYTIGVEYLGLSSLFMSIMMILNISELGIGSVMVYFLYAPAACGDTEKIDAYLKVLHNIYIAIGCVVLAAGMVLTPLIHYFISGAIPSGANVYFLFILYLLGSVIQYFLCPEEVILIEAFQRKDLTNRITMIAQVTSYIIQVVVLLFFHNFVLYIGAVAVRSILQGIMRKYYGSRFFSLYKASGDISDRERHDIRVKVASMIGHQIDEQLFNSIDTIFISAIVGLTAVTLYSNYFCVITAVSLLSSTVFKAILPSMGNAVAVDSPENNYKRFLNIFWLGACFAGWTTICMICLYQNFMYLWMGKDHMLGMDMVILFCLYSYLSQIRRTVTMFKDAAGMWWNDRFKPYISMAVDLALDAVLINRIGIKGAIISSIFCIAVIEIPWETRILFRDYFHRSAKTYICRMILYGAVNAALIGAGYGISVLCISQNDIASLLLRIIICCVSVFLFVLIYYRTDELKLWKNTLKEYKLKKANRN